LEEEGKGRGKKKRGKWLMVGCSIQSLVLAVDHPEALLAVGVQHPSDSSSGI